jgi:hypothetical protein
MKQRTVSLSGLPHLLNDCFPDVLVLVGRPIQLIGKGMELQQMKENFSTRESPILVCFAIL